MIRFIFPVLAAAALIVTPVSRADDADEQDRRQIHTILENVQTLTGAQQQRIQDLETEVGRLKAELARVKSELGGVGKDNVTQDQLKKVVDQLKEVDKKREADNRAVLEKFEELKKLVAALAAAAVPPEASKPAGHKPRARAAAVTNAEPDTTKNEASAPPEAPKVPKSSLPPEYDYVEHVVSGGETVGTIIAAYNKEKGLKIRLQHVLDANPKLKPERLKAGQKIKIPLIK